MRKFAAYMKEPVCFTSDLIEVFSTESGIVYQSDREGCLFVDFGGKIARYSFSCFQRLRTRLHNVDISGMLSDPKHPDFELITISACDHCYVLSALDSLYFRELVDGAFVMFELNHIIKDRLHRIIA